MSNSESKVPHKSKHIARKLIRNVFMWYFLLAISITTTQLLMEYSNAKEQTLSMVQELVKTVHGSLSTAIWEVDDQLLNKVVDSMNNKPFVSGIKIFEGDILKQQTGITNVSKPISEQDSLFQQYYLYEFPINYFDDGITHHLGQGKLFYSSVFIYEQVKFTLVITIINAFIKAFFLYVIAYFVITRLISKRLDKITQALKNLDLYGTSEQPVVFDENELNENDELSLLTHSFLSMQTTIKNQAVELKNQNELLEEKVTKKTQGLKESIIQLELEKQRVIDANKAKSTFLANMSHEIRTPMNGVLGMMELLSDSQLNKEQQQHVGLAQNSASSLLMLINDILDFSKIEADKLTLEILDFDLNNLLSDFVEAMALQIHDKNIELILDFSNKNNSMVKGDSGRIRQILTNLVSNAIKFTKQGHIVIFVELLPDSAAQEKDSSSNNLQFHCKVTDTGIGIPEDKQQQLFDSFTQMDDSTTREYGGTGLGLAIAKKLTELMGGEIHLTSKEGQGSCFEFNLQLKCSLQSPQVLSEIDLTELKV